MVTKAAWSTVDNATWEILKRTRASLPVTVSTNAPSPQIKLLDFAISHTESIMLKLS